MSSMAIYDPEGQRNAVTILFARMFCRAEDGPCQTCLDFAAKWVTPRSFSIVKHAMMTAVRSGEIAEGFGAIVVGSVMAEPNNSPPMEHKDG